MKLLITGHFGFIGSQAWKYFEENGHEVWGIDNLSRSTSVWNTSSRSIKADVSEIGSLKELDLNFDFILHLAAQVSVVEGETNPGIDFNTNALGTFSIVQFVLEVELLIKKKINMKNIKRDNFSNVDNILKFINKL